MSESESTKSALSFSNAKKRKFNAEEAEQSYYDELNFPETVKAVKDRLKELCFLTEGTVPANGSAIRGYKFNFKHSAKYYDHYWMDAIYLAQNKAEALLKVEEEVWKQEAKLEADRHKVSGISMIDDLLEEVFPIVSDIYAIKWGRKEEMWVDTHEILEKPSCVDFLTMTVLKHAFIEYDEKKPSVFINEVKLI